MVELLAKIAVQCYPYIKLCDTKAVPLLLLLWCGGHNICHTHRKRFIRTTGQTSRGVISRESRLEMQLANNQSRLVLYAMCSLLPSGTRLVLYAMCTLLPSGTRLVLYAMCSLLHSGTRKDLVNHRSRRVTLLFHNCNYSSH